MTAYLQSVLGYEAGWFVGTLALVLLIAFPLMLAVAIRRELRVLSYQSIVD